MDNLYNAISAWGIEPNIFLVFLALSAIFLVVITILNISVPFILLRISKELSEMNNHLRTLYIIDAKSKINPKSDPGDDNEPVNPKNSSNNSSKFQLDDDDIKKLKDTGFDIE